MKTEKIAGVAKKYRFTFREDSNSLPREEWVRNSACLIFKKRQNLKFFAYLATIFLSTVLSYIFPLLLLAVRARPYGGLLLEP